MRSNQPDGLDKLLDEALASYSSDKPRPGLERRVLSRIRADGAPRRFDWWRWAVAVLVFASLLMLAIAHRAKPQAPAAEHELVAARAFVAAEVPSKPRPIAPQPAHRFVNRRAAARSPVPRRAVFPLPAPLSAEERALVDLATRFPDQARTVLGAESHGIEPIEIPKIQIPPLAGGSEL